ncbi:hypothetical protein GCM10027020_23690 [Nocardioides salsibiostraticola]
MNSIIRTAALALAAAPLSVAVLALGAGAATAETPVSPSSPDSLTLPPVSPEPTDPGGLVNPEPGEDPFEGPDDLVNPTDPPCEVDCPDDDGFEGPGDLVNPTDPPCEVDCPDGGGDGEGDGEGEGGDPEIDTPTRIDTGEFGTTDSDTQGLVWMLVGGAALAGAGGIATARRAGSQRG